MVFVRPGSARRRLGSRACPPGVLPSLFAPKIHWRRWALNHSRNRFKAYLLAGALVILGFGFIRLIAAAASGPAADDMVGVVVSSGAARLYVTPGPDGMFHAVGHFGLIKGIQESLFNGAAGAGNAYFTIDATVNPAALQPSVVDGDLTTQLLPPGGLRVYFHPQPNQTWDAPSTFADGILIASYNRGTGWPSRDSRSTGVTGAWWAP